MSASGSVRAWIPPHLARWAARRLGRAQRFEGVPANTWQAAQLRSSGYDADAILQRVLAATRDVVAGRVAFERDSVTFPTWQAPFQLLAPLLRHALQNAARLDVVDFGGSLGSTYRQCLPFLPRLAQLRWQVVEQPRFVEAGREFADGTLSFHATVAELPDSNTPRVLLASSVVQYLPNPELLWASAEAAHANINTLIIDRTPVWSGDKDVVCVQHVPRHIYSASYPCWLLSEPMLRRRLSSTWDPMAEFDSAEGHHQAQGGPRFQFKGFVFERRRP